MQQRDNGWTCLRPVPIDIGQNAQKSHHSYGLRLLGTDWSLRQAFTVILAVRRQPGRARPVVSWQPSPRLDRKQLIQNNFLAAIRVARVLIPIRV